MGKNEMETRDKKDLIRIMKEDGYPDFVISEIFGPYAELEEPENKRETEGRREKL